MSAHYEAMKMGMPTNEYAYRKIAGRLERVEFIPGLLMEHPVAMAWKEAYRRRTRLFNAYINNEIILDHTYERAVKAVEALEEAVKRFKDDPDEVNAAREREIQWAEEDRLAVMAEEAEERKQAMMKEYYERQRMDAESIAEMYEDEEWFA